MGATIVGFLLGMGLGAATGNPLAALAGAVTGVLLGLSVHAIRRLRAYLREGTPTVERHQVMCFAYGQAADCELVGDLDSGRWRDVKRCSLLPLPTQVDCDKGCVRLMTQAGVRPGQPSS
jgi:hypothetical protein